MGSLNKILMIKLLGHLMGSLNKILMIKLLGHLMGSLNKILMIKLLGHLMGSLNKILMIKLLGHLMGSLNKILMIKLLGHLMGSLNKILMIKLLGQNDNVILMQKIKGMNIIRKRLFAYTKTKREPVRAACSLRNKYLASLHGKYKLCVLSHILCRCSPVCVGTYQKHRKQSLP